VNDRYSGQCLTGNRLLHDSITREAVFKAEMNILKMSLQGLTEKFFGESSLRQPAIVPGV
jgi:hypothetical protein